MYQLRLNCESVIYTDITGQAFYIPNDPANSDWQAYQKWLTELDEFGNPNQPLPAE